MEEYRIFRSLRAQLGAIFLGFLLLVGGSVTATFAAVRAQTDDAAVINLAGRQRMLTQRATWQALAEPNSPDLTISIQRFEETLRALRDGGQALDSDGRPVVLPPTKDKTILAQLDEVASSWTSFMGYLQAGDNPSLQTESSHILAQLDSVVNGFEASAQINVLRLRRIQTVFLAGALLLLVWGYTFTRRRIIRPLAELDTVAQRIGEGHLATPFPSFRDDDLGRLANSFVTMRDEIAASQNSLESRVAQRTQLLTTAFEFSQEIVSQLDLDHLLNSVTDRAQSLMQARAAALCLITQDGQNLKLVSTSGEANDHINLLQSTERGLGLQVVRDGRMTATEVTCSACGFLCDYPARYCIVAPLRVGQNTLGAMCVVQDKGASVEPDETSGFKLLANSAAIAIANARLAETGRRQAEHSAALTERERLAADLHDNLAQTLSFLRLKAERVEEALVAGRDSEAVDDLDQMKPALSSAYMEVRAALTGLREPPFASGELTKEFVTLVDEFGEMTGLPIELTVAEGVAQGLPDVSQSQILHIVREALTNAHRHAQASRIRVQLSRANGEAHLIIEDNGCGFNPEAIESDQHLGLAIMEARAQRSGGRLTINTTPDAGTEIIAQFPVGKQERGDVV
jgi:two-component system nitrate/nitrite sensor histidine kinase NarX